MDKIKTKSHDAIVLSSDSEKDANAQFSDMLLNSPIPSDEIIPNLGTYLTSKTLSRILFFHELYKKILTLHGVVMEFGVRWGQTLSLLSALRGIYEPFNRHRKIVGFDTFVGFVGMSEEDGEQCKCVEGSFSVSKSYEKHLEGVLSLQEALNPMSHIQRFELVKGNAETTIPKYFMDNPESVVSMAILDFDIYRPTKVALENIRDRMPKGSILVFDELCDPYFPGETLAVDEVFGIKNLKIERLPITARISYAVLD